MRVLNTRAQVRRERLSEFARDGGGVEARGGRLFCEGGFRPSARRVFCFGDCIARGACPCHNTSCMHALCTMRPLRARPRTESACSLPSPLPSYPTPTPTPTPSPVAESVNLPAAVVLAYSSSRASQRHRRVSQSKSHRHRPSQRAASHGVTFSRVTSSLFPKV